MGNQGSKEGKKKDDHVAEGEDSDKESENSDSGPEDKDQEAEPFVEVTVICKASRDVSFTEKVTATSSVLMKKFKEDLAKKISIPPEHMKVYRANQTFELTDALTLRTLGIENGQTIVVEDRRQS